MRTALVHHWLTAWPVTYTDTATGTVAATGSGFLSDAATGVITASGSGTETYSVPTPYDAVIDADTPISHWKLGATTLATDRKGIRDLPASNGPISTASGIVANNDSHPANSFLIGATGQSFQIASATGRGTPYDASTWTVEAWIMPSRAARMIITARGSIASLEIDTAPGPGTLRLVATDAAATTYTARSAAAAIATGATSHVVGTYDGTNLILYRNGAEVARLAMPSTRANPNNAPAIGTNPVSLAFDGIIDEVAWYNTALTPARILAHYQAGLPPAGGPTYTDTAAGTITASGSGVETYEPPAAGTVYTDAQTGAITSAGSALESAAAADTRTGTITASGTALESAATTDSSTGQVTASGTATENAAYADARTATATASGTAVESADVADTRTGAVTAAGTSVEAHAHASAATGTLAASGTGIDSWAIDYADAATGALTASGAGTESYQPPAGEVTYTDATSGTIASSGTGSETYQPPTGDTIYTDATAGTLTATGTALESAVAVDGVLGTATGTGTALDAHTRTTAATGTATTTGASLETAVYADTGTGTLAASGSGTETYQPPVVHTDATAGTLTLTGTATDSHTAANTPTGVITATGTKTENATAADTQTGTLTAAGTSTENATRTYNDTATGALTASGVSTDLWLPPGPQHVDVATGQLTATGNSLEYRAYEDTHTAGPTADGSLEHSATFVDTCPGTIRAHGTGTLTLTRQRLRPGHSGTSEPVPPYPAWPTPGTLRRPRRGTHPVGAAGRQRTPA